MAKKLTVADRAYVAGFLDGEGTVGCNVSRTTLGWTPYLRVAFANYDDSVLRLIKKLWGGSLSEQKSGVWALHLNGAEAAQLCRDVFKFCIIKKEAVGLSIKMYSHHNDRKMRIHYAIEIMESTRRGYRAVRSRVNLDRMIDEYTKMSQIVA